MMFRRVPNKMEQTKELNGFYVFMRMETILPNFMRNWHSFTTSLVQQIVMWRNRDAKERSHIKNNNYFLVITPAFTEPGHCVLSRRAKCPRFHPYTLWTIAYAIFFFFFFFFFFKFFEGMWKCQVNHMIIPAFIFSSPILIRNDALLVIDCSGCAYYKTEMQVCNLVVVFVFLN